MVVREARRNSNIQDRIKATVVDSRDRVSQVGIMVLVSRVRVVVARSRSIINVKGGTTAKSWLFTSAARERCCRQLSGLERGRPAKVTNQPGAPTKR